MGLAALTSYRGDVVLAAAGRRANIPAIMSGWSLIPLEEVAAAAPDTWLQAYLSKKQDEMDARIKRVEASGLSTLVIKALSLGAACVFIGRPFNHACAVAGPAGIDHAIDLLRQEISRNMAMMGVASMNALDPSFLVSVPAQRR